MYILVDINSFYCSCERLFNPGLQKKALGVLSNNDGCIISLTEELKALGVKMGTPSHMIPKELKEQMEECSSNYPLYDSISSRTMRTIARFVPRLEIYSIDEAFGDLYNMPYHDATKIGLDIKKHCWYVGVPVCVGIAATKVLAKMANRYAKKKLRQIGVFCPDTEEKMNAMLTFTKVEDIWGVGASYATMLHDHGFHTAADFKNAPDDWIYKHMTVVGLRLLSELRGIPAIEWEVDTPLKKNVRCSRSFGKILTGYKPISEAVANHAARCAEKLRAQNSCSDVLYVYLHTNKFRLQDKQYTGAVKIRLPRAANDAGTIIKYAGKALSIIYRDGYNYVKCGIEAHNLVPGDCVQNSLFACNDNAKSIQVNAAMDRINKIMDKRNLVRMASQGYSNEHALRSDYLSNRFTTNINEIMKVS